MTPTGLTMTITATEALTVSVVPEITADLMNPATMTGDKRGILTTETGGMSTTIGTAVAMAHRTMEAMIPGTGGTKQRMKCQAGLGMKMHNSAEMQISITNTAVKAQKGTSVRTNALKKIYMKDLQKTARLTP